jgi:hypothetical protein
MPGPPTRGNLAYDMAKKTTKQLPTRDRVLDEVRLVTSEIDNLNEASDELRAYRVDLCRQGRQVGITTRELGEASGVSGVAVTLWLKDKQAAS